MKANRTTTTRRSRPGFIALMAVVVVAGGVSLLWQWQERLLLRATARTGSGRYLQRLIADTKPPAMLQVSAGPSPKF